MPQNLFPWNNPSGLREQSQPNYGFSTDATATSHVLTAAKITGGADDVVLSLTGTLTGAQTATTDTATNIVAAIPQAQRYVGANYRLRVINASSGAYAWTIAGGTGVTVSGTATIAQNTWREFIVTVTAIGTPAVTLQSIGTGTYS